MCRRVGGRWVGGGCKAVCEGEERKVREVGGGWRGGRWAWAVVWEKCACVVFMVRAGRRSGREWQEYCSVYCVLGVCAEYWCVYWCVCMYCEYS